MVDPKSFYRFGEIQTSWKKYETRISKSETNTKSECPNVLNGQNKTMEAVPRFDQHANRYTTYWIGSCFCYWDLCHWNLFRVSCFGFRIYIVAAVVLPPSRRLPEAYRFAGEAFTEQKPLIKETILRRFRRIRRGKQIFDPVILNFSQATVEGFGFGFTDTLKFLPGN